MIIENSYSENLVNARVSPLTGYNTFDDNQFRLTNKSISSWSFDGIVPTSMDYVLLWNKDTGKFNVKPGQHIIITDDENNPVVYPVISIYTDENKLFYNRVNTGSEVTSGEFDITDMPGDGTEITAYAINNLEAGNIVSVHCNLPAFDYNNVTVTEATPTYFKFLSNAAGGTTGTVRIEQAFNSNVFIKYLDEKNIEQVREIVPVFDVNGYPRNQIYVVEEKWENKNVGSTGWTITSGGNSIFNNVAVRGQIEAQSGNFAGYLTVNNGDMRLGAGVSAIKEYQVSSFEILSNKVILDIGTGHTVAIGHTINVSDIGSLDAMAPVFPDESGVVDITTTGTQATYYAENTLTTGSRVTVIGTSPSTFDVQNAEVISVSPLTFTVASTVTDVYTGGGTFITNSMPSNAVDINGTYVVSAKTDSTISYDFTGPDFPETAIMQGTVVSNEKNDGLFIGPTNYWYSSGIFKVGNNINNVSWDNQNLKVYGDMYANTGRIGAIDEFSDTAWKIETGRISSGSGADSIVLASPNLGFSGSQTINRYYINKLVIDNEGGGLSTLYLHVTVPNLETFLETELGITISDQSELDAAVDTYFSTKPIAFKNVSGGEQNIFSTSINPNLKSKFENKWLNVQAAVTTEVSLVNGSASYALSSTTDLVVLEFYGEDYAYIAYDEIITSNVGDTYHWTAERIDVLSGSTGAGRYVFWTGSELPEDAPFSISTDGSIIGADITSTTLDVSDTLTTATFVLNGHTVTIDTVPPVSPADGDIWIELV